MVQTLVMGGQKHSTIAIESASERLRKFINKNLKEEQILNAVKVARENGLKGLKIYSMIGIPNETQEDIDEFLRLAKILKNENKGFYIVLIKKEDNFFLTIGPIIMNHHFLYFSVTNFCFITRTISI